MTKRFGKKFSFFSALGLLILGLFFLIVQGDDLISKILGAVFIATSIFNFITDFVINPSEPFDERVVLLRRRSGLISYIFIQLIIVLLLFLALGGIVTNVITVLLFLTISTTLVYPLILFYLSKRM